MSELEALVRRLVDRLDSAGVPFMIAGSFASTAHGLPRTTQDLDIVIDPPDAGALDALLRSMATDAYLDRETAHDAWRTRSMFNVVDNTSGWKIDFIIRKNRAFSREEFARRMKTTLLGTTVYVASAEDTIIAKLEWSRKGGGSERQRRDIAGIIATTGSALDRPYIERWVDELGLSAEWSEAKKAAL